jgi:hypothetical protein
MRPAGKRPVGVRYGRGPRLRAAGRRRCAAVRGPRAAGRHGTRRGGPCRRRATRCASRCNANGNGVPLGGPGVVPRHGRHRQCRAAAARPLPGGGRAALPRIPRQAARERLARAGGAAGVGEAAHARVRLGHPHPERGRRAHDRVQALMDRRVDDPCDVRADRRQRGAGAPSPASMCDQRDTRSGCSRNRARSRRSTTRSRMRCASSRRTRDTDGTRGARRRRPAAACTNSAPCRTPMTSAGPRPPERAAGARSARSSSRRRASRAVARIRRSGFAGRAGWLGPPNAFVQAVRVRRINSSNARSRPRNARAASGSPGR